MEQVGGNFLWFDVRVHDVPHVFHLELVVAANFHEPFLEEHLFVKELALAGPLFEAFWDFVVPIDYDADQKVVFRELELFI